VAALSPAASASSHIDPALEFELRTSAFSSIQLLRRTCYHARNRRLDWLAGSIVSFPRGAARPRVPSVRRRAAGLRAADKVRQRAVGAGINRDGEGSARKQRGEADHESLRILEENLPSPSAI
jgi:hypothetical protein